MCDRVHIETQIKIKECDQVVKFFVRNVVNECICAHVKLLKLYPEAIAQRFCEGVNLWGSECVHRCTRVDADGSAGMSVILYAREQSHICTCAQMHIHEFVSIKPMIARAWGVGHAGASPH